MPRGCSPRPLSVCCVINGGERVRVWVCVLWHPPASSCLRDSRAPVPPPLRGPATTTPPSPRPPPRGRRATPSRPWHRGAATCRRPGGAGPDVPPFPILPHDPSGPGLLRIIAHSPSPLRGPCPSRAGERGPHLWPRHAGLCACSLGSQRSASKAPVTYVCDSAVTGTATGRWTACIVGRP